MGIAVYDTFVTRPDGRVMHFDIMVPTEGKTLEKVLAYGRIYLKAKGIPSDLLTASECRFCHTENAVGPEQEAIEADGFAIIELNHCD